MTTVNDVYGVGHPRVSKFPLAAECVNPSQVIGMELEIENCTQMTLADFQKLARANNFQVKSDGSLRGVAYEFVSNPMRSDHALAALNAFLTEGKFGPANYSDRCSVHIHANCSDMEMEQVATLALLYTVVEEVLFEYVGNNRDSNIYCIPWNQCRAHLNLVNSFLREPGAVMKRWSKYTALNLIPLSNLGTVEFRQLNGTADMERLTTWINIVGALFNQAKSVPLKDLIAEIKSLNSTSHYEQFFSRVLANQLPYSDAYREKLEAGVIFAKYSLISMEGKRRTPRAKDPVPTTDDRAVRDARFYAALAAETVVPAPMTERDAIAQVQAAPLGALLRNRMERARGAQTYAAQYFTDPAEQQVQPQRAGLRTTAPVWHELGTIGGGAEREME